MKKSHIALLIIVSLSSFVLGHVTNCREGEKEKKPVYVEYFKAGQVLLPDYACPDTLIVVDAVGLNKAFAYVEQDIGWGSDADCDSLIHQYCKPINDKQP